MTRTVLVTGGAGYVGSHTVLHFKDLGWRAVILDDFSTGHRGFASHADRIIEGSLLDQAFVAEALASEKLDGIVHCAGKILVGESVQRPVHYFRENIVAGINLVEASVTHGAIPIVFSSTAAVYGDPSSVPIPEDATLEPVNPYGFTKLALERLLEAAGTAHGLSWMALRYFNAAGADAELRVGEDHSPETHLIPNIFRAVSSGLRLKVFGDDYETRDGTCLRDYVHVGDVARAHALALRHLWEGGSSDAVNLGSGSGFTVREVLEAARRTVGRDVPYDVDARRPGDPPALVADNTKAGRVIDWQPALSTLESILGSAWGWHRQRFGEG